MADMATNDEAAVLARAERLLAAHPELEPLEAVILVALDAAQRDGGRGLDTGRLAREFDIEHALVRRAVSALEDKGWLAGEARGGRSPGLRLTLLRQVNA